MHSKGLPNDVVMDFALLRLRLRPTATMLCHRQSQDRKFCDAMSMPMSVSDVPCTKKTCAYYTKVVVGPRLY